jgi:tetratricopeptide (TPR) repeat protein
MKRFFGILACISIFIFSVNAQTPGPLSALQHYRRGRDLEAMNRTAEFNTHYSEAVRICLEEVSRNAATRETYTVITWTLQRQRKYAEVRNWGERGLQVYPDEFRIVETMGEAFFYMDDYEHSLSHMQHYVNALPQGDRASVAFFFIGEIYRLTEKYHHADIAYTAALHLESNVALWWYRLGSVREALGDRRPAFEAYQQALRYNSNYREARNALTRLQ